MDSETNMHDTRTLIDTRRYRANQIHVDSNYHSLQPLENKITVNHPRMINNNDENQNEGQFRNDRQYHSGADYDTTAISNSREKSPETTELVRIRIELARPEAMRPQWNRGLGREIYVPRRPKEDERREIKKLTSN